MSSYLKTLWKDYGIVSVIVVIVGLYVLTILQKYFSSKSSAGSEKMSRMGSEYEGGDKRGGATGSMGDGGIKPAFEYDNETYSSVNDVQVVPQGGAQTSGDLLPSDQNSKWSDLNPTGGGELVGINLLQAGYHIGIDTIGQTLRNANLQERSEPPNPQISTGPWNQSTIEPDYGRVPLELGQGTR